MRHRGDLPIEVRAVHEAAHVIAAQLHGCAVRSVSVVESAHSLASVNTERNLLEEIRACSDPSQQLEIAIAEVSIALAGPAAQARCIADDGLSPDLRQVGCQDDWKRCDDVRTALGEVLSEQLKKKLFITAQERAQIVKEQYWAEVRRLALRLQEAGTLDQEAVARELAGVQRRWPGPGAGRGKLSLVLRVAVIATICVFIMWLAWDVVGSLLR